MVCQLPSMFMLQAEPPMSDMSDMLEWSLDVMFMFMMSTWLAGMIL